MDLSDTIILKNELQKGNHKALVFLMDKYHHSLCLYAYSLSNDYEGAKDIVQDVFVKLWEDREKVQSVKSMRSFLNRAVYNGFIDQWRKNKRMLSIEAKHFKALEELVEDERYDLTKQIELVNQAIESLPPKCKETFVLSRKEGLTNIEISEFMDVSIRTVETQINKAFKILRKTLKTKIEPILFLLLGLDSNKLNYKLMGGI
ncbi:RNA polymerase sigma factor [Aestuariivivens sp. NBU2969]|uniref:RNA polymerase sigma factor n=1 Tax=Aestuariivivens sp. NBU2969 TaxID=2873267 RepID=UPI001CBC775F|nr:RNA polymerase sigma-70 factor [Aestuariivivens sp. NBU2969]